MVNLKYQKNLKQYTACRLDIFHHMAFHVHHEKLLLQGLLAADIHQCQKPPIDFPSLYLRGYKKVCKHKEGTCQFRTLQSILDKQACLDQFYHHVLTGIRFWYFHVKTVVIFFESKVYKLLSLAVSLVFLKFLKDIINP